MANPYFFGYGSLVNSATHDYVDPQPAQLTGWRRSWAHTGVRQIAFLTITACAETKIDGLIAAVPDANWAALDQREWAYKRLPASELIHHSLATTPEISIYAVPPAPPAQDMPQQSILLSYLDVVVQGYAQVFGPQGVRDFFATTDGWEAPILNDRATPQYPRHQQLSRTETTLVDDYLQRLGASITVAA